MCLTRMNIVAEAFMETLELVNQLIIQKNLNKSALLHIVMLTMILAVFLLAQELIMLSLSALPGESTF